MEIVIEKKARKKGTHLNFRERNTIEILIARKVPIKDIALEIGCNLSTIYRELKRYKAEGDCIRSRKYDAEKAQKQCEQRWENKGAMSKIDKDQFLKDYITEMIVDEKYSPNAIILEIAEKKLKFDVEIKSANTIYAAIRAGKLKNVTMAHLPTKEKRLKRKVKISKRIDRGTSIEERPIEILARESFGHWEMDSVIGKITNNKTALVLTERMSRYEVIEPLKRHTAKEVVKALNRIEKRMGKDFYNVFQSITVDNGKEFSDYKGMEKALYRVGKRTKIFYCHTYASQERGSNENQNRFIRRWLPKGTDFDKYIGFKKTLKEIEEWINRYPREMFNGKSARVIFEKEYLKLTGRPF